MSAGHRLIEHSADMGLEAWGANRAQVFCEAAQALREMLVGESRVSASRELEISVDGGDDAELLVNWLNELLYLYETRGFVLAECEVEARGVSLRARARGESFDAARHVSEREAKAVTHHQAALWCEQGLWRGRVYVDL